MPSFSPRYLVDYFNGHQDDLDKMVFITGPRQVGKTILPALLAKKMGYEETEVFYLNWDQPEDRKLIRSGNFAYFREMLSNTIGKKPFLIFDEIHKFRKWKNFLKGFFDSFQGQMVMVVTGSARLDTYRRGGDSLLGRYWLYHMYPFTLSEALGHFCPAPFENLSISKDQENGMAIYQTLYQFGGFPEPFLKAKLPHHLRWVRMRRERLLREDLRDLSRIQDLSDVEAFMGYLRESVTSPLSLNSIREKMEVSHNAVRNWLKWLESIYYCYRVSPYSKKVARSLKKEGKYYLYDWSELKDDGARFENLVSLHLKKSVDFWNDTGAGEFELFYVRDQEKREVDFLIVRDEKPWLLVEAKLGQAEIPKSLHYMGNALHVPHRVLVTHHLEEEKFRFVGKEKYLVCPASRFLNHCV